MSTEERAERVERVVMRDEGGCEEIWSRAGAGAEEPNPDWSALQEEARERIRACFVWPTESRKTTFLDTELVAKNERGETIEEEKIEVRFDPPLPCEGDASRGKCRWDNPHELLGGLEENPGVRGHGGGAAIMEVCRTCGSYRETLTHDQDTGSSDEWEKTTRYLPPDGRSLEWSSRMSEDRPSTD